MRLGWQCAGLPLSGHLLWAQDYRQHPSGQPCNCGCPCSSLLCPIFYFTGDWFIHSYSFLLEMLHWQPNYLFRTSQTHGFLEHYFVRLLYSLRWAVKKLKCLKKEAFFSRDGLQQWHSFICRLWVCLSQSSHWQPLPITDTKVNVCQFGNLKSWKLVLNSPLLL